MSRNKEEEDYWNTSENRGFDFDGDKITITKTKYDTEQNLIGTDDNISESSYELPHNEIPIHLLISEQDLRLILDEQSLTENSIPKHTAIEDEVRILRRQLQERLHPPAPSTTITKMLLGKTCTLDAYKSLDEKEQLLDEAISSGNGDAILQVILFIVKTLKRRHVNRIFQTRPIAVNHYVNYLALRLQLTECTDLLTMLGRNQEAAMLQYQAAVQTSTNPDTRKQKIKKVFSDFYSQSGSNSLYTHLLTNYIILLEWQIFEKSTGGPETTKLLDSSVLESLYYTCSKHKWGETTSSNSPTTPQRFVEMYQISPAQFEWIALNERGRSQAWRDVESLFEKKSWHSIKSKSFSIHIPLDKAILKLFSLNAPPPVLNYFLGKMDDQQRKLQLSRKINAVRSIVDALVALKDKTELEVLKERLEAGTEEKFYAENALKNLNAKWKTDGMKLIKS